MTKKEKKKLSEVLSEAMPTRKVLHGGAVMKAYRLPETPEFRIISSMLTRQQFNVFFSMHVLSAATWGILTVEIGDDPNLLDMLMV